MEAKLVARLPEGAQWRYEPKWDGFRVLVYRDGDGVVLQSKAGLPLGRYFPELEEATRRLPLDRFVLDGEIVVPTPRDAPAPADAPTSREAGERHDGGFSFDDLLLRVHPAESRVRKLAAELPAAIVLFDALVVDGRPLLGAPLDERRAALEAAAARAALPGIEGPGAFRLCPTSTDRAQGQRWLDTPGAADTDGVVAKRRDLDYRAGERDGMQKVKRMRSADCVVGGFRYASRGGLVGSLLLGLYDDAGLLHHVGFCSTMPRKDKPELTGRLEALRKPPGFTGHAPGGPSRWATERSTEWEPLDPVLVVEVRYDHWSGGRFRHGTKFLRWRPDKAPRQCTFEQVEPRPAG
ncbi:MAG: ATP-dependent DNA ligase [Planctomycetes bacterium]|nr:ATP-dependent DNA ligase [Planctomycetota bacterium]